MATTKKFGELQAKMSPQAQARSMARMEAMLLEMNLQGLRKSRNVTQAAVAQELTVNQAAVSKLEQRGDMYLSTLRAYVEALGGKLKIVASFDEADFDISKLHHEG